MIGFSSMYNAETMNALPSSALPIEVGQNGT
jgi:hypothetical protein